MSLTTDKIPAKKLRKDDIIVEGRSRRVVNKVQVNAHLHHTHVNDDWCYDNDAEVEIVTGW